MRTNCLSSALWLLLPSLLAIGARAEGSCECPRKPDQPLQGFADHNFGPTDAEIAELCDEQESDACTDGFVCVCTYGRLIRSYNPGVDKWEIECEDSVGACVSPGPHDDPHMTGLLGQRFDWAGTDGEWYSMLSDGPDLQMNVRVTAPLPEFPDRQLITAVSLVLDGGQHSLVLEVQDPHSMEPKEDCLVTGERDSMLPCLAKGALRVNIDGQDYPALPTPAKGLVLPDGHTVLSATNLPAQCQPFGGGRVWAEHFEKMELMSRRTLGETGGPSLRGGPVDISLEDWVLLPETLAAPEWCAKFLEDEGVDGLLKVASPHTVFRINSPMLSLRIDVGTNHEDSQVLPDGRSIPQLEFWQANVGVEWGDFSSELAGMLGETSRVVHDVNGKPVMRGLEVLAGPIENYRVSGPLDADFKQLHIVS